MYLFMKMFPHWDLQPASFSLKQHVLSLTLISNILKLNLFCVPRADRKDTVWAAWSFFPHFCTSFWIKLSVPFGVGLHPWLETLMCFLAVFWCIRFLDSRYLYIQDKKKTQPVDIMAFSHPLRNMASTEVLNVCVNIKKKKRSVHEALFF